MLLLYFFVCLSLSFLILNFFQKVINHSPKEFTMNSFWSVNMGNLNTNPTKGPQKIMANKCSEANNYWMQQNVTFVFSLKGSRSFKWALLEKIWRLSCHKAWKVDNFGFFPGWPIHLKDRLTADTLVLVLEEEVKV